MNPFFPIRVRQNLPHAGEQIVRVRQSKLKRRRLAFQFGRQLHRSRCHHQGPPGHAKLARQIAHAAADPVVIAIARKILEQKNRVPADLRDVRQHLFRLVRAIDRRPIEFRKPCNRAPRVEWHVEFRRDRQQEIFEPVLFRGFDGDDGISRIDQQAQLIVLAIRPLGRGR